MSFERTMPKKFLKSNYHVIWHVNKFLKYILLIMLLQLFQFFPFALLYPAPPIPSSNPPTIVHVHGSCVGSLAAPFPILYFTSPSLLRCTYLFDVPFAWNIFFLPFTFFYVYLSIWDGSLKGRYGSCFLIHSGNLCLLVRAFKPFTFKVIIDRHVCGAILLLDCWFFPFSFFFLFSKQAL